MKYTEYRVVCRRDCWSEVWGVVKKSHHDVVAPRYHRFVDYRVTRSAQEAARFLKETIEGCAKFDAEHTAVNYPNVRYQQYDIRIQSRVVTDWEDEENGK